MDKIIFCFENLDFPSCVWFEAGNKRNVLASVLAGLLFFAGWWIIVDVESIYPRQINAGHACAILGTVSLIMINSVSNSQIRGVAYEGGCLGTRGAKIFFFFGFVLGFASVIGASGLLYITLAKKAHKWPGVGLFLQNVLIFAASLVYKFGRVDEQW